MTTVVDGELIYSSTFDQATGVIVRATVPKDHDIWRKHTYSPVPETIDMKIIEWCDFGCSYCYMDSKPSDRRRMPVNKAVSILSAFKIPPYQVALGGGEPLGHPELPDMLAAIRGIDVVPNLTTAGHLRRRSSIDAINTFCGGVALTYHRHPGIDWFAKTYEWWHRELDVQLNVHLVASEGVAEALDELTTIHHKLGGMSVTLLAYYATGRGTKKDAMSVRTMDEALPAAIERAVNAGVSISYSEGMIPYFISRPWIAIDTRMTMPQEGLFSCYVDIDGNIGTSSFTEWTREPVDGYQAHWENEIDDYANRPSGDVCSRCRLVDKCSTPQSIHYLSCAYARKGFNGAYV